MLRAGMELATARQGPGCGLSGTYLRVSKGLLPDLRDGFSDPPGIRQGEGAEGFEAGFVLAVEEGAVEA